MATIDFDKLIKDMSAAFKLQLIDHWSEAKPFAEKEIRAFSENLRLIGQLKLEGKINEEQAKLYVEIQKSSMRIVMLTIKGLGILAVEAAINAALDAVRTTVNTAIGWAIL
jgi:hypothetical protein